MFKQFIFIVLLSVVTILFKSQISDVLDKALYLHNYLSHTLQLIFSDGDIGRVIQDVVSLLLIPLILGLLAALGYWLIKRSSMPYTMNVIWVVWLILLTTMVAQDGMVTTQMSHQSKGDIHSFVNFDKFKEY